VCSSDLGILLTGSIVGAPFQGGNAWSNWSGHVPYADHGLIVGGGDFLPLPERNSPVHAVVFEEFGLPPSTTWFVQMDGVSHPSTHSLLLVYEADGAYSYAVPNADGRSAFHAHGIVTVRDADVWVPTLFYS
jgi:hypothetical protein